MTDLQFTSSPVIEQVIFVRRNILTDARKLQFQFEEEFASYMNGATTTPVPTPPNTLVPPDAPRFVMQDNRKNIAVTNGSAQLTLNFSGGLPNKQNLLQALAKPAEACNKAYKTIYGEKDKFYCGLVIFVNREIKGDLETLYKYGAEATGVRNVPKNLNGFNSHMTWGKGDFNVAMEINQFLRFNVQAAFIPGMQEQWIDGEFEEPASYGLQIKIDVNDKPAMYKKRNVDYFQCLDALRSAVEEDFSPMIRHDMLEAFL